MDRVGSVGELVELTSMTQPAASQHLRVLRDAAWSMSAPMGRGTFTGWTSLG